VPVDLEGSFTVQDARNKKTSKNQAEAEFFIELEFASKYSVFMKPPMRLLLVRYSHFASQYSVQREQQNRERLSS
jgi:hypothetical protein